MRELVEAALKAAVEAGELDLGEAGLAGAPPVTLEAPRRPEHGDFATNIAMSLARVARKKPREIAEVLAARLKETELSEVDVAGPGFINLRLPPAAWGRALGAVHEAGDAFGHTEGGAGKRVLVEYVSANPTGPMHVGHGRGAVTGDVVATLLTWAGYEVGREFYVNDAGNQIKNLVASVHARYLELLGETVEFPEDGYPGDYIMDCAKALHAKEGERFREADEAALAEVRAFSVEYMLDWIHEDLAAFGIVFDDFASELSIFERGLVKEALEELRGKGLLQDEPDGAVLFRATEFGDDKDRAVLKRDGTHTYLAADLAYHRDKLKRGNDWLINIWGADHAGYVSRMKASIQALGRDPEALTVVLVQMVNLTRDGEPVRMGKRSGTFVPLREVIDEVGRDAARLFFIMRRSDAQFDFDLELAKKSSLDNPVHYVKYGHARCASLLAKAEERGLPIPAGVPGEAALAALGLPEEVALCREILSFPQVVAGAAQNLEPHRIVYYLQETIAAFHSYYTRTGKDDPILSDDPAKLAGRLFLVQSLKQVLKNGLLILGVEAPERMDWSEGEQ
ncbi:MAG: arginine--tRNA ligase [Deltaproteobacteria bacterium]|nr:arginine--tRNA ligase [Deltaproteobacteria bacterium]